MTAPRRAPALSILVVAAIAACSADRSSVPLLTSDLVSGKVGCYPSFTDGALVADPVSGSAIGSTPVVWPKGYVGRQADSEVEILDASGYVVARTGTEVHLAGGRGELGFVVCPEPDPETVD